MKLKEKQCLRQKRVWRIRKKVVGTSTKPRLCLHVSNKHIYAQAIDDEAGKTLFALSTLSKTLRESTLHANVASATALGKAFGEKAKTNGITTVIFDRNGRLYHGTVKAFAEAVREAGLTF